MRKNIITSSLFIIVIALGFLSIHSFWEYYQLREFEKAYRGENYQKAQEYIEKDTTNPIDLHNLGNTYFMQALLTDEEEKPVLLQKSLISFSGSLQIEEHPDTRYNYEFVKKLLKPQDEEPQDEEETSDNGSDTGEDETGGDQGDESDSQEGEGKETKQGSTLQDTRSEQYKLGEQQNIETLTEAERDALKQASEGLKQDQGSYQQFYNKKEQSSDFQKAFDTLLNRGGEKDW